MPPRPPWNPIEPLLAELPGWQCTAWRDSLQELWRSRVENASNGHLPKWKAALEQLPLSQPSTRIDASSQAVRVLDETRQFNPQELRQQLLAFHPWRKGPFEFFGLGIDTEWQSWMKWERLAKAVDFRGKRVLDVGCGNGYYGWKMLEAGAEWVIGCDPYLLYLMQFLAVQRYVPKPGRHFIVPLTDQDLPDELHAFDLVLSMGVLYHRTSPIDHLLKLGEAILPGGELVIETLVIETREETVLVPVDRYAKMRNVWFIPSLSMLTRWLKRTGYDQIDVIDVSPTTIHEQRRTEWMTYESLSDFLDPNDNRLTIEGYPAPRRAMVRAQRRA
jgi:tRNA (mo5U34)-methyltransferase